MCKLRIHELLLFLDLHQHKLPCLWLWDSTQRFQITNSNDLVTATRFYHCLIVDLALVDSCIVRRYKTSQISQRVTHKSSKSLKNVARVSLLYVDKLEWNPKCFYGLGPCFKLLQNLISVIPDRSSLISRLVELDWNWLPFSAVSWTWSLKPILLSIAKHID